MPLLLFLLAAIFAFILWNLLKGPVSRWIRRFIAHRTEDILRKMMGMPTRKEEQRSRKRARKQSRKGGARNGAYNQKQKRRHPAALMKTVAEDVDFIEITEFESHTVIEDDGQRVRIKIEEQISDAEYVEIRK